MGTPVLRAVNVSKRLGGKVILDDVSLDVAAGELKVLIGPSGAGKSTFLQCLNYLVPPDAGSIILDGTKLNEDNTREICGFSGQVGMFFN